MPIGGGQAPIAPVSKPQIPHYALPNHVYRLSVHLTTIYMSPGSD